MIFILILILGFAASIMGPWWIAAPIAWIICRWRAQSGKQAFGQSALAIIAMWSGYAIFIFAKSNTTFIDKMAGILTSTAEGIGVVQNSLLIFGICTFLAGLIGGLAGLAGYQMKKFAKVI